MASIYARILALTVIYSLLLSAAEAVNGTYETRFENADLDLILSSRRLVNNYVDCLMDTKPCTSEGDELKRILPDAVQTSCVKCSRKQRQGAKKVIDALQNRYPHQWATLKKRWDLDNFKDSL